VPDGEFALWLASSKGYAKVVEILLNHSVDPDSLHPITGDSALQLAIMGGHQETIQVLRSFGASSNTINLDKMDAYIRSPMYKKPANFK
jgi:ankyrin repeat protein